MMSTPTRTTMELAIRDWIVIASGLAEGKVVWAQRNAPMPAEPFITLQMITDTARGWPILDVQDAAGPTNGALFFGQVEQKREPRVDVNIYGAEHRNIAKTMEFARWLPASKDLLADTGVTIAEFGEPTDMTERAVAGDNRPRTMIELRFYGSDLATYDAHVIETTAPTIDPPFTE